LILLLISLGQKVSFAQDEESLSLNFNDAPVTGILRTIAKLAQHNLLLADDVQGNMSLFVKKMNWPAALQLVLQSQHLQLQELNANTWYISKAKDQNASVSNVNTFNRVTPARPLSTRFFSIHYADPEAVLQLIQNNRALLPPEGQASIDRRTSTLVVSATEAQLSEIEKLLNTIDVPVPQVQIDARIVVVNKSALQALGVVLGQGENNPINLLGSIQKVAIRAPLIDPAGVLGFSLGSLNGQQLDLELQALETSGDGKIIAAPNLTVSNNQEAYIEEGNDVPYQTSTSSGATQIEFKKAVLGLKVTPQITGHGMLDLALQVNKDSVTARSASAGDVPIIATAELHTNLLVRDGQTVVLGGIYTEEKSLDHRGVPVLSGIPGLGWLFRSQRVSDKYTDLLVFITPRILSSS